MKNFALIGLLVSALAGCADMPFHDEAGLALMPGRTLAAGDAHPQMQANRETEETGR